MSDNIIFLRKIMSDGIVIRHIRVVSRAGLFGSGSGLKLTKTSGLIRAWDVRFALGAQKYNQNNLATLLNFSDLPVTKLSIFSGMIWASN